MSSTANGLFFPHETQGEKPVSPGKNQSIDGHLIEEDVDTMVYATGCMGECIYI